MPPVDPYAGVGSDPYAGIGRRPTTDDLGAAYHRGELPPDAAQRYEAAALQGAVHDPAAARTAFLRQQTQTFQAAGARPPVPAGVGVGGGVTAPNAIQQDDAAGHRLAGAALTGLQDNALGLLRSATNPSAAAVDSFTNGATWAASHLGQPQNRLAALRNGEARMSSVVSPDLPAAGRRVGMNVQPQNMAERGAYVAGGLAPGLVAGPEALLPLIGGGLGQFGAQEGVRALGGSDQDQQMAGQVGGIVGGGLGAGLSGLRARQVEVPASPLSPQRVLSNAGVDLTPGQMFGGAVHRVEDAATSIPFLGDAIKGAQRHGIETYNRVELNRTLAPIGQTVPRTVNVGREGVAYADKAISDAYNTALNPVTEIPPTPELRTTIQTAVDGVQHGAQRTNAQGIADDVLTRFAQPIDGQTWKALDSDLNREIANATTSDAPGANQLARALRTIRDAIRAPLPEETAGAVQKADAAYARMARFGAASSRAGTAARGGLVSPAQMDAAVRSGARGTPQYRRGQALGQDLTEPAMQVLPPTVPDSGSPLRHIIQAGGAVAAGEGAHMLGPEAQGAALVGGGLTAAGMAAYSRPIQALLNTIYRASGQLPGSRGAALETLRQAAVRDPSVLPAYQHALAYTKQLSIGFEPGPIVNGLRQLSRSPRP